MSLLFSGFSACPERVAFSLDEQVLTYGELDRSSAAYAAGLHRLGINAGDRVAVQSGSSSALIVALLGHLRSGVIHVPINTRYRSEEIAHILDDSGASLVLSEAEMPAAQVAAERGIRTLDLAALPQAEGGGGVLPSGSEVAMLIYTSGTTGRSKGVALTLNGLSANVGATTTLWRWSASDHLILTLPLFHVHGLGLGVLGTLFHRMQATVHRRFEVGRVVEALTAGGSIFMGVPTMYARLIAYLERAPEAAEALQRVRLFTSGSAALPASDHEAFERLTGQRILERYGMSETGFTLSNPYEGPRRAGTVGFAVPGYAVRVVDEAGGDCPRGEAGEIWVRGDGMMSGYWRQPEASAAALTEGWFRPGDVARVDAEGYHQILGRRSADIIKRGGFKISAIEIEDVLLRHPSVQEVAVLGVPDPEWGEQIVAVVVCLPGQVVDAEALIAFGRAALADYKCPSTVYQRDSLPRNALGKLQKHRLAAALRADE